MFDLLPAKRVEAVLDPSDRLGLCSMRDDSGVALREWFHNGLRLLEWRQDRLNTRGLPQRNGDRRACLKTQVYVDLPFNYADLWLMDFPRMSAKRPD